MESRLILGDCLERMAEIDPMRIAAVVCDPPYGMRYKSGPNSRNSISSTGKRYSETIRGDDRPFDPTPWLGFPLVAFTGAHHFYDRLPPGGSLHCWDKRGDYKPLDQADADVIWCSRPRVPRVFHLAWRGLCRHAENRQRIVHPTQKPVALMGWMMDLLGVPPGAIVLDPYMGSGTTGLACLETGRRFIGIESDPVHFATAERRLAEGRSRTALFAG